MPTKIWNFNVAQGQKSFYEMTNKKEPQRAHF
jgi:hypothetical protein